MFFFCFTVNILKDFCVIAVAREKTGLGPLNALPTGRPMPLAKVTIETPPAMYLELNTQCS